MLDFSDTESSVQVRTELFPTPVHIPNPWPEPQCGGVYTGAGKEPGRNGGQWTQGMELEPGDELTDSAEKEPQMGAGPPPARAGSLERRHSGDRTHLSCLDFQSLKV